MLVNLNISLWTGRKLDKSATTAVTYDNNADEGVVQVSKKLLGDCPQLKKIQKFVGSVRNNTHYYYTMPWADSGARLLPTKLYFRYHKEMTELEQTFFELVEVFLGEYSWEVTRAQVRLGNLFNLDEYPTTDTLRSKFNFVLSYLPLPESGDWRVDIAKESVDHLKENYETYFNTQIKQSMDSLWSRLYDTLANMSKRLDYSNAENKIEFKNSLVSNVTDMVDMLKMCNVSNCPQMSSMAQKLHNTLNGVTTEALRENGHLRMETKKAIDAAIRNLPSLGF
tara:strand:- start:3821 stop:4663 length:843 start_codon:yes stop_codon:yes gene_type:complete